ncbi:daxx-like protein isoform X1 [Bactrocera neohumeralis]|uniref:daxx-like protein isoform X1 n=1 Tax=Bactrocera neohumeralis TaxID=98809 RepID=UPI002164FC78|nr:daxx-like protein isoform X1 [Bactrocera neohumeralis]
MSSVIVLDSSDEDEVPTKKAFIAPSIPATITPIKGTATKCSANVATNQLKHKKTKPRPIPSGITITRRSPVDVGSSNITNSNSVGRITVSNITETAAKISAETVAATSKLILSKTAATSLLKINANTAITSLKERQTPTPPRHLTQTLNIKQHPQQQQVASKQQQQQQQLPHLSQLPQLQPSPSVLRKRLSTASSPTQQLQMPPQQQPQPPKLQKSKQQQHNPPKLQLQKQQHTLKLDSQVRKISTPPATIGPSNITTTSTSNTTLMPLISSVQSMAAGATPPLQLLATPPHSAATTFSDHQLFSPKLMHTTCSLPPSTSVTAARTQLATSINTNINNNTNNSSNTSNNNKNINNNFKIMLPPKNSNNNVVSVNLTATSTASASAASLLATPVALQQSCSGPRIAYVNSLATQISPTINKANSNSLLNYPPKVKTSAAPVVPIAITPATSLVTLGITTASASITTTPASTNAQAGGVRRVKPTTLLRKNDEAWLKRAATTTTAAKNFKDDDLVLELLPHTSNTKTTSVEPVKNATKTQLLKTSKAPETTAKTTFIKSTFPLKIDLTESPEKTNTSRRNEIITISPTISPTQTKSLKNKSNTSISNGEAKIQQQPAKCTTPIANEKSGKTTEERLPLTSDYEELLKVCREADTSADMEKLVKTKLIKYYYNVHPDFVRSKGFGKNLRTVITNIQKEPDLVYLHLKTIVDELKVRSKNKETLLPALIKDEEKSDSPSGEKDKEKDTAVGGEDNGPPVDDISSTGNKHTDEQIKKLNKALYILTKRIEVLESAEVDWDEEDSSYLQVERFKKRACQIYEKICDLTGESKNAHRLVKKPIHFNGTTYTQFNKTLQAYINRTKEFPDYFDVLRMLEHCNRQYDYALANFEMKRIAHDAFVKVGKLLQSRRKTDLYETVTHFTAHEKDPATIDASLQAKLSENQKKRTRISDVIEKYAREQDMIKEELKEARQAKVAKVTNEDNAEDDDAVASTSANAAKIAALRKSKHKNESGDIGSNNDRRKDNDDTLDTDEEDDDDDEDEEDDEEQVNGSDLEADVEKLANGILSDVESDIEIVINSSTEETKERVEEDAKTPVNKTSTELSSTDNSASTKTKTVAKTDLVNTQKAVTVTKTDKESSAAIQTNYTVNNNLVRQKTADPLSNDQQKVTLKSTTAAKDIDGRQTTIAIANGRTKLGVTQSNANNPTAIAQAATIKIVSVSSLKNVNIMDSEDSSIDRMTTNRTTVQTKMQTPNTTMKEIKRQRTVAEIVISDEES